MLSGPTSVESYQSRGHIDFKKVAEIKCFLAWKEKQDLFLIKETEFKFHFGKQADCRSSRVCSTEGGPIDNCNICITINSTFDKLSKRLLTCMENSSDPSVEP